MKEVIPQLAFDRVFRAIRTPVVSSLNPKDPSILTSLQRDDTSILDLVVDDANTVRRQGSAADKVRLDEYFDSVRSVEHASVGGAEAAKTMDQSGPVSDGPPVPGMPDTA